MQQLIDQVQWYNAICIPKKPHNKIFAQFSHAVRSLEAPHAAYHAFSFAPLIRHKNNGDRLRAARESAND